VTSSASHWPHFLLEAAAYFVAARLYWRARNRELQPPPRDRLLLLACATVGALVGSKLLHVLEHLPALRAAGDAALWLAGKSVLGGFLGGTIAVELTKRAIGWRLPTGDAWVAPIAAGLVIGRLGCQFSGTWDLTYGAPTALPWGWNYGDGVPRHPAALYEVIGVGVWFLVIRHRWTGALGARFAALLTGYCVLRFAIEWLKPPFGAAAPGALPVATYGPFTAIQWAAVAGTIWYAALWRDRLRGRVSASEVRAPPPLPASV
jgi:phosphatidylglycerol---prolipoprotein diacylglyceryl transferase